ncbi:MAG: hypothetical protein K9H16_12585 [Bacteroidales bacterium]|nr:hypothetical protein [Bacteroidales bacterium]
MEKDFNITDWNSIKWELQKRYPELTKSDLLWRQGSKEDVLQMIAQKLGIARKDLETEIEKI